MAKDKKTKVTMKRSTTGAKRKAPVAGTRKSDVREIKREPVLKLLENPKVEQSVIVPAQVLDPQTQILIQQTLRPQSSSRAPVDERNRAREERRAKKQRELEELHRRREAANNGVSLPREPLTASAQVSVNANVATLADARKRHSDQVALAASVPQLSAQANPAQVEHITIPMSELLKYKLLAKETLYKSIAEPIKLKLRQAAQEKLKQDIAATLRDNQACAIAADELEACVNEVLDSVQGQLPSGYAVVFVATTEGNLVCKHAPDQVGKRFKLA